VGGSSQYEQIALVDDAPAALLAIGGLPRSLQALVELFIVDQCKSGVGAHPDPVVKGAKVFRGYFGHALK
jgi:hypothetical protein